MCIAIAANMMEITVLSNHTITISLIVIGILVASAIGIVQENMMISLIEMIPIKNFVAISHPAHMITGRNISASPASAPCAAGRASGTPNTFVKG